MSDPELRSSFLARLAGGEVIPGDRIVAVVAHADDETIGLGAQLPRMPGIRIVHVTDGAPRNLVDARRKGFATAEEYAAARRRELEAAAALAGVPRIRLISLGVADQDAAFNLVPLARRIAELIEREGFEVVLTHAYEGGHPDHDATAFAANAAARISRARTGAAPRRRDAVLSRRSGGARQPDASSPEPERPNSPSGSIAASGR